MVCTEKQEAQQHHCHRKCFNEEPVSAKTHVIKLLLTQFMIQLPSPRDDKDKNIIIKLELIACVCSQPNGN